MIKTILWHLLVGTRGGKTRTRILDAIWKKPDNLHKLSKRLELDYKTVQYHMRMLEQHNIVTAIGDDYGATYHPSELLRASKETFSEIRDAYGKDLGKRS